MHTTLRRTVLPIWLLALTYFGFAAGTFVPQNVMAADHRVGDNHEHAILHEYPPTMWALALVSLCFFIYGLYCVYGIRKMDQTGICSTCRSHNISRHGKSTCYDFDKARRSQVAWKWTGLTIGTYVLTACIGCIWWIQGWSATV